MVLIYVNELQKGKRPGDSTIMSTGLDYGIVTFTKSVLLTTPPDVISVAQRERQPEGSCQKSGNMFEPRTAGENSRMSSYAKTFGKAKTTPIVFFRYHFIRQAVISGTKFGQEPCLSLDQRYVTIILIALG